MTEGRAVGLVGVLLALIGGVLLLIDALDGSRRTITLDQLARIAFALALVVAAFLAATVMYKSRYSAGGLLGVVVGAVIAIVHGGYFPAGILVALGGVLGVVAAEMKK